MKIKIKLWKLNCGTYCNAVLPNLRHKNTWVLTFTVPSGVNFTKLFAQIAKLPAHSIWHKVWHSMSPRLCTDEICQICTVKFIKLIFRLPNAIRQKKLLILLAKKAGQIYVGEIDPCSQFHQRFTRTFFVRIFCQSQNVTRKSCRNNVRTKNLYVKLLVKSTPVKCF